MASRYASVTGSARSIIAFIMPWVITDASLDWRKRVLNCFSCGRTREARSSAEFRENDITVLSS